MEINWKEPCVCKADYPTMVKTVSLCQTLNVFQALFQIFYMCNPKHAKQPHYYDPHFTEE